MAIVFKTGHIVVDICLLIYLIKFAVGESSGKANKSIARMVQPGSSSANLHELGQRATSASSEVNRAHQLMVERGDKLSQLEDRAERMHNQAQDFSSSAHNLMLKYKDKKWYHL